MSLCPNHATLTVLSVMSAAAVVPAHLAYLAIYNPTLGPTDESLGDQIVFYYSHKLELERQRRTKKKYSTSAKTGSNEQDDHQNVDRRQDEAAENERLRQVGLAQGMVSFVK